MCVVVVASVWYVRESRFSVLVARRCTSMFDESFSVSGIQAPRFLYGTAWKEDDTRRLTALALRQGFRGIDTANQRRHYCEAEQ